MNVDAKGPNDPIENLAIGKVIEVDGAHIVAELEPKITDLSRVYGGETYPIGQFGSIVKIHFGRRIIYAFVGRLRMKAEYEIERGVSTQATADERVIEADLFGEGEWLQDTTAAPPKWTLKFERGIATYPLPQQTLYLTPKSELRFVYGHGKGAVILLGEHVGSGGTPCFADLNELLGKHTAILGSTGAGKSGTVAAVVHSLLERGAKAGHANWQPRIVILDPHNEYGPAFAAHRRLSTDEGSLKLPYWLLNLQEIISLVIGKTEFVATSQANIVKSALLNARVAAAAALGIDGGKITVDSPTPFSLDKFKEEVNVQRPAGKDKKEQEPFNSVINKLETLQRDTRMGFMLSPWDNATDPFPAILSQFIGQGEPVRIVDLSGVPNEVAGIASAAIARTLFNFKIWQSSAERESDPVLLICEEAHRYVPNRGEAQYEAAQEAIRRIAKEGRKYGLGLILVSQRPSEVEATVLSQCNSWIVHRITNDADREHVKGILPDSVAGLTKMLSGLRRREAIFVGQAAMLPSRILIRELAKTELPRSHDIDFDAGWQKPSMDAAALTAIAKRWRYQER
jgi:DNA helicase HerA-like ATPase